MRSVSTDALESFAASQVEEHDLTSSEEVYSRTVTVVSVYSNGASSSSVGRSEDSRTYCAAGTHYYVQDDTSVESDWDFDDRAEQSFKVRRHILSLKDEHYREFGKVAKMINYPSVVSA